MVILGIDPGLNRMGYAVLSTRPRRLVEGGVVRSTRGAALADRVLEIRDGLVEVIEEHRPTAAAIEQVFSMPQNPKTAVLMAHARGAILVTLAEHDLSPTHFTPTEIKKLMTGSGRAGKEQIQAAVRRELGLAEDLEPNDVSDATAVALCLAGNAGLRAA